MLSLRENNRNINIAKSKSINLALPIMTLFNSSELHCHLLHESVIIHQRPHSFASSAIILVAARSQEAGFIPMKNLKQESEYRAVNTAFHLAKQICK